MPASSSVNTTSNLVLDSKSQPLKSNPPSSTKTVSSNSTVIKNLPPNTTPANKGEGSLVISEGFGSSVSSISEYLMETLPGWHVEDFLDFPSTPCGFIKFDNNEILQFDGDDHGANMSPFGSENMGIWVPQAHPNQEMGGQIGLTKETIKEANNRTRWSDDAFTVPQISPPSTGCKRSRSFW